MAKTAVIGAGSWGTALSLVLHTNGNDVTVWSIVEQDRRKRLSDPCGAVCFYEKHGKIYGTFCKKGTGDRLCGKRY